MSSNFRANPSSSSQLGGSATVTLKLAIVVAWIGLLLQMLPYQTHHQDPRQTSADSMQSGRPGAAYSLGGLLMFAEAGKKKKEKSEVVVISVSNPAPKGMGQMYPIFVPSCGGGGHFGRRRRKRSTFNSDSNTNNNYDKMQAVASLQHNTAGWAS